MNEQAPPLATLARVTLEVLERYAFVLADPHRDADGPVVFPTPLWQALIAYAGPSRGALGLVAPPALACQIAANLYGLEPPEVSEEQAQDALKELLNIICGEYLHEIEGDEPIFDLTAPALEADDDEPILRHAGDRPHATLNVEGAPLLVFLES